MDHSLCGGLGALVFYRSAPDQQKAYRIDRELLTRPEALEHSIRQQSTGILLLIAILAPLYIFTATDESPLTYITGRTLHGRFDLGAS